jgi:hypothetical protein
MKCLAEEERAGRNRDLASSKVVAAIFVVLGHCVILAIVSSQKRC